MTQIYPSLISADLLNLQREIERLDPYVPGYHLDIMDFHYVPNLTWGPAFMDAIAGITKRTLWVHLMVDNPNMWVEKLQLPAGSILDFHIEKLEENKNIFNNIQNKSWQVSVAVSPKIDVEKTFSFLNAITQVTIMSVEPGRSGQAFLPHVLSKVEALVDYRKKNNLKFSIAMDGGISEKNIKEISSLGVDRVAIAHALFSKPDPIKALQEIQKIIL